MQRITSLGFGKERPASNYQVMLSPLQNISRYSLQEVRTGLVAKANGYQCLSPLVMLNKGTQSKRLAQVTTS